jgi:hypothetical protein
VARGAQYAAPPIVDDLEEQQLLLLSLAEVEAALLAGRFKALAWSAGLALALLHLKR